MDFKSLWEKLGKKKKKKTESGSTEKKPFENQWESNKDFSLYTHSVFYHTLKWSYCFWSSFKLLTTVFSSSPVLSWTYFTDSLSDIVRSEGSML